MTTKTLDERSVVVDNYNGFEIRDLGYEIIAVSTFDGPDVVLRASTMPGIRTAIRMWWYPR